MPQHRGFCRPCGAPDSRRRALAPLQGLTPERFPIMSLTLALVRTDRMPVTHLAQLTDIQSRNVRDKSERLFRFFVKNYRELFAPDTAGNDALSDELVGQVLAARRGSAHRPHGDTWSRCAEQRAFIERHLRAKVRLSKIRKATEVSNGCGWGHPRSALTDR